MTTTQRWTPAVVSAATAMLMLDIAVVNTALSRISSAAAFTRSKRPSRAPPTIGGGRGSPPMAAAALTAML